MNIQFENLPAPIQQEILRHLETDNFKEAKRLRDTYENHLKHTREEDDTDSGWVTTDTSDENRASVSVEVY